MKLIRAFLIRLNPMFLFLMVVMPLVALADVPVVPDGDPLTLLLNLIFTWKSAGPLALGMGIVVLATQVVKKLLPDFQHKRLVVTILSCAYGVVLGVSQGLGWLPTVVAVLVTGGGAVAIYEAFKGASQVVSPAPPAPPVQ